MGMNVLSLFDGMSCGQIALNRAGIKYDKYFASEIDKHAIKVTQANYPDTIQLGSVVNVRASDLPEIFLMQGGSPCQSFSFAGKRKGMSTKCEQQILSLEQYLQLKSDGFEFEGQSYLFWEFVRLLHEVKPKYFLLENVMMEEKWEKIITRTLGVHPVMINSALVSAQNRKRLYWTNIGLVPSGMFGDMVCGITQPKDKGILLRDILETEVDEKYYISDVAMNQINRKEYSQPQINPDKTGALNTKNNSGQLSVDSGTTLISESGPGRDYQLINSGKVTPLRVHSGSAHDNRVIINIEGKIKPNQDKASCFTAGGNSGGNHSDMDLICVASRGRNPENPASRQAGLHTEQQLEPRHDGKTNTLTSVQKDNLVMQINPSKESNGQQPYQQNRVYDADGISPALCRDKSDLIIYQNGRGFNKGGPHEEKSPPITSNSWEHNHSVNKIRRLTPTECERLQTVDSGYTAHVSDTQRYRMLGNGWTVDVIAHIFSFIPSD